MKRFIKYKYTIYGIISDVIIISSVLFYNVSIVRILGFYWLDTCVSLFYFMLFWKWVGRINYYFDVIASSIVIIAINCIYFPFVLLVAEFLKYDVSFENLDTLFYPYYDVAFFLLVASLAHYQFFRKMRELAFKGIDVDLFANMNCVYSMFLLPVAVILSFIMVYLVQDAVVAVLLTFILLRDRMDYWRYKKLNSFFATLAPVEEPLDNTRTIS
jgi:hypothetical protein